MKQLARTLLILGGVTACERAEPIVDRHERPAVGNIGQTGRPRARPAQPLIDPRGAPAVGNIGQTGAPPIARVATDQATGTPASAATMVASDATPPSFAVDPRTTRVQRLHHKQRAARAIRPSAPAGGAATAVQAIAIAPAPIVEVTRPLVDQRERPMVGNIPRKCSPCGGARERLASEREQVVASPLLDARERPAVGNVMTKGGAPTADLAEAE